MDMKAIESQGRRRFDDYVEALRAMVDVDCGTYTPEGVNRVADMCEERFRSAGWDVERRVHEASAGEQRLGDVVIGRLSGEGGPRVLLIGHTDTVFPEGTASERPFRLRDGKAFGPGVSDMKGGLLAGFFAVEVLQEIGSLPFRSVTYVCNPDEEIGSPFSGPLIRELAGEADVTFVLEAARENGDIVSARKGVSDARIEVAGRAAHAGVEPERGRSAVLEAAHKTLALHALNGRWPGVSVNVGVVEGGIRPNVVPERCFLAVDVRGPDERSLQAAEAEVRRIAEEAAVDGTSSEVTVTAWHRPMEKTRATERLVGLAADLARALGFELRDAATGGASDANTTAAAGVPTLDGLGPVGGREHSPEEWLDMESVVPRVSLLAGLVANARPAL
ncbi:MAG TPA: M20 family metallopeptidase [Actinomycetota bacterium]|jgi:glutamate carboxypeptidase|nr:M20 family metallopeptidase [Actinomycetota bacterium]